MESLRFGHVALEVASITEVRRFHDRFLGVLGFRRFQAGAWYAGYRLGDTVVWFFRRGARAQVRRERPRAPRTDAGVIAEHVGLRAGSWSGVARTEDALVAAGFVPLYRVDRSPPRSPDERYRSAAWVDPDRIVWEVYSAERPRAARAAAARARRRPSAGRAP